MLAQERLELSHNPINKVRHLVDRIKNQLSFGQLRLAERYISSELKILVRLSFIGGSGKVCDFIAYYQRHESVFIEPERLSNSEINSPFVHSYSDGQQEPMLVNNVELVEQPERLVRSDVRLYRLDDVQRIGRDLLYFSIANGRLILLNSVGNGKVNAFVGSTAVSLDKLPHQVIKSTPKIVDSISKDERDFVGNGFDFSDIKRRVLNLRYSVRLGSNSIGLILKEPVDSSIQFTDVLFGPFNFQSDSVNALLRAHAL